MNRTGEFRVWHRVFLKGCGIVPGKRNAGSTHEVRKFDSLAASIKAYIFNPNLNSAYRILREIQSQEKLSTGAHLAVGLLKYSERGEEYVRELRQIIKFNKLDDYEQRFFDSKNHAIARLSLNF
jgi:Bax protein